ncbi:transmembrane protein, putative [Medicago truncatula]|uniref:Transmembrane protein, putative n=1 Tax=Medicago truncatula TaxID=3880 RepID=A0A072VHR4_MEDTR|nr:transmembrane protein, putative [Medicago truncatula]
MVVVRRGAASAPPHLWLFGVSGFRRWFSWVLEKVDLVAVLVVATTVGYEGCVLSCYMVAMLMKHCFCGNPLPQLAIWCMFHVACSFGDGSSLALLSPKSLVHTSHITLGTICCYFHNTMAQYYWVKCSPPILIYVIQFCRFMDLVFVYSDDGSLLLVTGGHIFLIRVVILLHTGVTTCVFVVGFRLPLDIDLQLCCLVLAGRDAVELVVLVMMRCGAVSGGRGGDVWWWSW